MSSIAGRRRDSLTPAFIAALCLHVGLFAALTIFRPALPLPLGSAVPITIVSKAPATNSRPAEPAPQTQTAQVEEPVPQAKPPSPPPVPPQPAPTPEPPRPVKTVPPPRPTPRPTPAPLKAAPPPRPVPRPTPAPPKPTPPAKPAEAQPVAPRPSRAPPTDTFNLDKLQASIARAAHAAPSRPAFAARGPARAETAPVVRPDAGQGVSQSDLQGLQQLLERLWNPECGVEGDAAVLVPIRFSVGDDGRVSGRITDAAHDSPANPVAYAAARRAIDAVHEAEPYADVYRGKTFTVNFDAKKACAGR